MIAINLTTHSISFKKEPEQTVHYPFILAPYAYSQQKFSNICRIIYHRYMYLIIAYIHHKSSRLPPFAFLRIDLHRQCLLQTISGISSPIKRRLLYSIRITHRLRILVHNSLMVLHCPIRNRSCKRLLFCHLCEKPHFIALPSQSIIPHHCI